MPETDRSSVTVRKRSKELFRNSYMLEICAAINPGDGRVNLATLVGDTGLSPSLYAGPLRRLVGLGLLLDDPRPDDDHRERWYTPVESQLWVAARELVR